MRHEPLALVYGVVATVVWLLLGVIKAVRDALSVRAATWLLPAQQSATFRLGQLIAHLADIMAPRVKLSLGDESMDEGLALRDLFPLVVARFDWASPRSALAEIQADLRAERRVLQPLRLTAPLLWRALLLNLRNLMVLMGAVVAGAMTAVAILGMILVFLPLVPTLLLWAVTGVRVPQSEWRPRLWFIPKRARSDAEQR